MGTDTLTSPRSGGDLPLSRTYKPPRSRLSPLRWGSSAMRAEDVPAPCPLPAQVGSFPQQGRVADLGRPSPRSGGDLPLARRLCSVVVDLSSLRWGSSDDRQPDPDRPPPLPAQAGIFRSLSRARASARSFPRSGGDLPNARWTGRLNYFLSPFRWGSSAVRGRPTRRDCPLPAQVGIFPRTPSRRHQGCASPRPGGDCPLGRPYSVVVAGLALHEQGLPPEL